MKSAFYLRQELTSEGFGTLLYGLLPKGIYQQPNIDISGTDITVSQSGIFLFYDDTNEIQYAIKIGLEKDDIITGSFSENDYVYLSYTYSKTDLAVPTIVTSKANLPDDAGRLKADNVILLGKIIKEGSAYILDTTDQEYIGSELTFPAPSISSLKYLPDSNDLNVSFKGYFQSNNKISGVESLHETAVDKTKGYRIYIRQDGVAVCQEVGSDAPAMGRTILAEKAPNSPTFVVYKYPKRAEITADSLVLSPSSLTKNKEILNNIYTNPETINSIGEPILSKVVQRLVVEVQALRSELDSLKSSHDNLTKRVNDFSVSFTTNNLTVNTVATFNKKVVFTGAEVQFTDTSIGSPTNPIKNLYVSNVLYAKDIRFFS